VRKGADLDEATGKLLTLLNEYGQRLHQLLTKLTLRKDVSEDLLQDLFIRLSKSSRLFRSPSPERYLFRAAINLAFRWRRENWRSLTRCQLVEEDTARCDSPVDKLIRREDLDRILAAMGRMKAADRELITLRYINDVSFDVLARDLGSTPHRVRALCSKAIARLRKLMGAEATRTRMTKE